MEHPEPCTEVGIDFFYGQAAVEKLVAAVGLPLELKMLYARIVVRKALRWPVVRDAVAGVGIKTRESQDTDGAGGLGECLEIHDDDFAAILTDELPCRLVARARKWREQTVERTELQRGPQALVQLDVPTHLGLSRSCA